MVDLHIHILPGVDDGSRDYEDSVHMAAIALDCGVDTIVATPHANQMGRFENFWSDMGPTWKKGLDLDRIDNNAGYNPENCRWTTRRQNALNRRKTVIIEKGGQRIPLSIAAEKTGISTSTLSYRMKHNWPEEYLFVKPDCRNKCTTSGIVVRGTDSPSGTGSASA